MDLAMEKQSKKGKCKLEEEDQPRKGINSLPSDIAVDILSRLPISSLLQLRFTCKSWKKLSYDPNLVRLHFSRTAKKNPCLIFHCANPFQNQLYFVDFTNQEDEERVRNIHTPLSATMPVFNVVGSCNGLLCITDSLYDDKICIYNPFTGYSKELPKSPRFQEQEVVYEFGFHPVTNEYKVIKIIYYANVYNELRPVLNYPNNYVQIFSLGSTKWKSIGKAPYRIDRQSSGVLVNGRLHWVTRLARYNGIRDRIIVSFDIADEEFREVPKPDSGSLYENTFHLTVLGGRLSAIVNCTYGKLEIWAMKEYNVKESWVKEFNIESFLPKLMNQELENQNNMQRNTLRGSVVRVLHLLKNGEILIEYGARNLVSYNPKNGKFKSLEFRGLPDLFKTFVHEGSLNSIDNLG